MNQLDMIENYPIIKAKLETARDELERILSMVQEDRGDEIREGTIEKTLKDTEGEG